MHSSVGCTLNKRSQAKDGPVKVFSTLLQDCSKVPRYFSLRILVGLCKMRVRIKTLSPDEEFGLAAFEFSFFFLVGWGCLGLHVDLVG